MIEARSALRHLVPLAMTVLVACTEATGGGGLFERGTLTIRADGAPVDLRVEIAESIEARVQGLGGRERLPADAGMVFLPPEPERQVFTMRDTLIPLSVAWWDEGGRIIGFADMEPCRREPCPTYDIGEKSAGAVEANQGFFDRHGVEPGAAVTLERSG